MHTCLKCGRIAQSVEELEEGCFCGSKVFVFKRDLCQQKLAPEGSISNSNENCANSSRAPICPCEDLPSPSAEDEKNAKQKTLASDFGMDEIPLIRPIPPSAVASSILSDEPSDDEPGRDYSEVWLSKGAIIGPQKSGNGAGEGRMDGNKSEIANAPGTESEGKIEEGQYFAGGEGKSETCGKCALGIECGQEGKSEIGGEGQAVLENRVAPFEIENIRQLRQGVFEVDLLGVDAGPLVVKDQEGVYYVRLPFAQTELGKKKEK